MFHFASFLFSDIKSCDSLEYMNEEHSTVNIIIYWDPKFHLYVKKMDKYFILWDMWELTQRSASSLSDIVPTLFAFEGLEASKEHPLI